MTLLVYNMNITNISNIKVYTTVLTLLITYIHTNITVILFSCVYT